MLITKNYSGKNLNFYDFFFLLIFIGFFIFISSFHNALLFAQAPNEVVEDVPSATTGKTHLESTRRLKEVIVKGKKRVGAKINLQTDELKDNVQFNFPDVIPTLKNQPGVSFSGDSFSSDIYIQGGDASEWIGLYEHVWVLKPFRWNSRVSMFNPKTIDTLSFYTGAYPASVGQGLSGVLWAKTIEPSDTTWHGSFSFGTELEAIVHGPISKHFKVFMQVRRSWIDWAINSDLQRRSNQNSAFPYLLDGSFKFIWTPDRYHSLQLLAYGSHEASAVPSSLLERGSSTSNADGSTQAEEINANDVSYVQANFKYNEQNYISSLKYTYHLSYQNYLVTTASIVPLLANYNLNNSSLQVLDVNVSSLPYQFTFDANIGSLDNHKVTFGFFSYHYNIHTKGKTGISFLDTKGNWTNINNSFDTQFQKNYYSLYALDDYSPFDFIVLQVGVRGAYYEVGNEWVVQPRGGIKINAFNWIDLFYRAGYYTRNFLDRSRGANLALLKSEKSIHQVAGIEKKIGNTYFLAEGFYKDYWNLRASGTRLAYGFDTLLKVNKTKSSIINGGIGYTYTRAFEKIAERKQSSFVAQPVAQLNKSFTPDFLREHTANVSMHFFPIRFFKSLSDELKEVSLGIELNYLSGKPYTPATNVLMYEIPNVGKRFQFVYDEYNSARTAPVYNVNLKFTTPAIALSKTHKIHSYIALHNVFSTANVVDVQYGVKSNHLKNRTATITRPQVISLGKDAIREVRVLDAASTISLRGGVEYRF